MNYALRTVRTNTYYPYQVARGIDIQVGLYILVELLT